MQLEGSCWVYGNNINTDEIIPARYLNTSDSAELAKHCMEDVDTTFAAGVRRGDLIVAGDNFGCGSSREHAPVAIKAAGVSVVVARSFARIFFRNAVNIGLAIIELPSFDPARCKGRRLRVNLDTGAVVLADDPAQAWKAHGFPPFMKELMAAGGLIPWARQKLAQ